MDTRLRISGHPVQPVLMTFPVGLFFCAVTFDLGRLIGAPDMIGELGYWTAVAGLVASALVTVAGLVDLWDVPVGPTRRAVLTFHVVNAVMTAMFLVVCLTRATTEHRAASGGMFAVEVLALAVGGLGVRLGAGLVHHYDATSGPRDGAAGEGWQAQPVATTGEAGTARPRSTLYMSSNS